MGFFKKLFRKIGFKDQEHIDTLQKDLELARSSLLEHTAALRHLQEERMNVIVQERECEDKRLWDALSEHRDSSKSEHTRLAADFVALREAFLFHTQNTHLIENGNHDKLKERVEFLELKSHGEKRG